MRGISRELDIVALFYSRKILSGVPGANQEYYDKINSGLLWNELYQLRILLNATLDNNLSEIGKILMGRQQSGFFRLSLLSIISLLILLSAMYSLHIIFLIRSQKKEKKHIEQHSLTLDVIIDTLAYQVELRDNNTGRHIERTSQYVEIITRKLAETQGDETYLTEAYIRDITSSSILHDIGKIGIPDNILLKPGCLSDEEFDVIKLHCSYGADTLRKADEKLPFDSYLTIAIQLAESHHERWDGTGYPYGLRGEEIPLSGRIMTVADVYDAMRSERVYKSALPHEECLAYIREQSGKKFDPRIVDAFVSLENEIKAISLLEEV